MPLTEENYQKGFLVDDQCMAGIATAEDSEFNAFVLDHTTGEYLSSQSFPSLDSALQFLNQIPRSWIYESVSNCGEENCAIGGCGKGECKEEKCRLYIPTPETK